MVSIKSSQSSQFPPLLHLTFDLQQLSDKNLLSAVDMGIGQVRILSGLHTAVPRSQRELALILNQTEANVSRQLRILKRQRLVSVTKNKKDGRQRDVKLTAKGAKAYKLALKVLEKQQKELMKLVGAKEQKVFDRSLEHLLLGIGKNAATRRMLIS